MLRQLDGNGEISGLLGWYGTSSFATWTAFGTGMGSFCQRECVESFAPDREQSCVGGGWV